MQIQIRQAKETDIEAISKIYEHIHTEQEKGTVYTGWVRGTYPVRKTAEDALLRKDLFVEEVDEKIVGTAIINQSQGDVYREVPWQNELPDEKIMVLHTLVIDPYEKGHGLGKFFVEYYEQYAAECGCAGLRMDTNELNTNARSFYQKLGYKEAGIRPCIFNGIPGVRLVMFEKMLLNKRQIPILDPRKSF